VTVVWFADITCLLGILAAAACVVFIDNLNGSVMALSAAGVLLTVLFVVLAAPDVAHSEAVVGAVVLPLLYLIAIGKIRTSVGAVRDLGEEGEQQEGSEEASASSEAGDARTGGDVG
jgi:uncharacterized MnhB-related membrane protein